jgi:hypothetical protein
MRGVPLPEPTAKVPPRARVRALAFVAVALASVALAEVALRVMFTMPSISAPLMSRGPYGARAAVMERDRASGQFPDSARVIRPTLGWTNPPGETRIGPQVMHANSQGLRGTREYPQDKPAGGTRVEVFGDSFAFGSETDDDATFAAQLEKMLPGTEVLNFGTPGYGLDQMLLRFGEEGRGFHPDVVVIGLIGTLRPRDVLAFTFWYKPYFVLDGDRLVLKGVPVPTFAEARRDYDRGSRLVDFARMLTWEMAPFDDHLDTAMLKQFVADIVSSGARPIIVLYPSVEEMGRTPQPIAIFHEACAATHAVCVDTSPAFAEASRGATLSSGHHFSRAGHAIVATALAQELGAHEAGASTSPRASGY